MCCCGFTCYCVFFFYETATTENYTYGLFPYTTLFRSGRAFQLAAAIARYRSAYRRTRRGQDRRLAPPDVCPQPPSPPGHLPGGNRLRPYRPLPWLGARPGRRAGLPPCATVARHQEPDTRAGRRQATDAAVDHRRSTEPAAGILP